MAIQETLKKNTKSVFGGTILIIVLVVLGIVIKQSEKPLVLDKNHDACKVFSRSSARGVLGAYTEPKHATSTADESQDVQESSCTYSQAAPSSEAERLTATLRMKYPRTKSGIDQVKKEFASVKNVQKIAAYGGEGYWDQTAGQMNILKHDIWYQMTFGKANATDRNLSQSELLTDILVPSL